ncbi:fatty acyl-CoA reductase 1-like isoform X2 [Phaseolus vulgaris]|uniref:fatty acyl-CoA reductase 1-like isoform X2 n=1 Tax=Phaseolus vulgaris TaxID=3885 RepID=UPI0035CB38A4
MELERMHEFFKGKTILMTGTTGFLAKVFLEKILRTQPQIHKLYLLVRAQTSDLAAQRFQNEVIHTDLFRVLRDQWGKDFDSFISKKIVVISGDVSLHNFGMEDEQLKIKMIEEINIFMNFAATTKFDERFDISMEVNTMGVLHVLNFAKHCPEIKIFVQISTAYVCGEIKDEKTIMLEKPFEMGQTLKETSKLDITTEMNLLKKKIDELRSKNATENTIKHALKDYGIERAKLYGWPNTYTFTKAMGEMQLVHHKENVPLIIIRPTMVTSTLKDPFPGWIEGLRTLDSIICSIGQGKITSFLGHPKTILDIIPADMVINCMMTTIVACSNQTPENFIYHISSSLRNPFRIVDARDYSYYYFIKFALENKNGKPIIVPKPTLISSRAVFDIYMTLRYVFPLKVLNVVNKAFCQCSQDVYDDSYKKFKRVTRLVEL